MIIIESPDPGHYKMISDFDIGRPGTNHSTTKRGVYSMGKKITNKIDPMDADNYKYIPGPGTYTSKLMTIGHSGPMFNLQGRSHNVNGKCSMVNFILIFYLYF